MISGELRAIRCMKSEYHCMNGRLTGTKKSGADPRRVCSRKYENISKVLILLLSRGGRYIRRMVRSSKRRYRFGRIAMSSPYQRVYPKFSSNSGHIGRRMREWNPCGSPQREGRHSVLIPVFPILRLYNFSHPFVKYIRQGTISFHIHLFHSN